MTFIACLITALAYYPVFIVSLVQRKREWLLHWLMSLFWFILIGKKYVESRNFYGKFKMVT